MKNNVIIVGAGINGLMCAYYLLKEGDVEIKVYDQNQIPNPTSASFGKHRLIHPWNNNGCVQIAQKALSALLQWRDILNDIDCDGFERTGVTSLGNEDASSQFIHNIDVRLLSATTIGELIPFLEDIDKGYVHHLPQFGVLFADKIMTDLVQYLKKNGVQFHEGNCAVSIDAQRSEVCFSNGDIVAGDKIIIAAGYGADAIVKSSFKKDEYSLPSFRPMRCYVAYVKNPKMRIDKIFPAWASLGVGDMWGMPPLRRIPMKLGCGDFTKPCDPLAADDSNAIAKKIIDKYKQLFPKFDGVEVEYAGINHWAEINSDSDYIEIDRAVIITSDNGAGFKFAPVVSLRVANLLCGITY